MGYLKSIWVKWADEFNDQYENGTTSSRWSAMIQDQFKGSEMEKIVQEALNERKVVWPWPEIRIDEGSKTLFKILKANGYKEWKNLNVKNYKTLNGTLLRMPLTKLEFSTGKNTRY